MALHGQIRLTQRIRRILWQSVPMQVSAIVLLGSVTVSRPLPAVLVKGVSIY